MTPIESYACILESQGVTLLVVGVAFLKKCIIMGMIFEVSHAQAMPMVVQSLLMLSTDQDVELLAPPPPACLPSCCHASHHENNVLNVRSCKPASIKPFALQEGHGHVSLQSNETLTETDVHFSLLVY